MTVAMTDKKLAEINARCAAVIEYKPSINYENEHFISIYGSDEFPDDVGDFFFMAANDMEALLTEIKRLHSCEMIVNIIRGLPLLTDKYSPNAALLFNDGDWEVVTISQEFWAGPRGHGMTPEEALTDALECMLDSIDTTNS